MKTYSLDIKASHSVEISSTKPIRDLLKEIIATRDVKIVVIRVDAGKIPGLSFGHLSRCMLLADVLRKDYGAECFFLMKDLPEGVAYARKNQKKIKTFPPNTSMVKADELLLNYALKTVADLVIIDLPYEPVNTSIFQALRSHRIKSLFIDDARFYNPGSDIYLNSSILAPKRVNGSTPLDSKLLLGPRYFIFDPGRPSLEKIKFTSHKKHIILSFGGADPNNLTDQSLTLLVHHPWEQTIFHIITGPGYGDISPILKTVSAHENFLSLIHAPDNIIPYFRAADMVICAGGRTMYELICLKKLFLPMGSTVAEADTIREFLNQGWIDKAVPVWNQKDFLKAITWLNQAGFF